MRRSAGAVGVLVVCALAGLAVAFALARTGGAEAGTAQETTTTTTPPPTTPDPEPPPPPPGPAPIAYGVSVGAVQVGGLLPGEAAAAVRRAFARPLALVVDETRTIRVEPRALGARANVEKAIRRARVARPGAIVALDVEVPVLRVRRYARRLAERYDREPRDARIVLRGIRPHAVEARDGRRLRRLAASRAIRFALKRHERAPIRLRFDLLRPKVVSVDLSTAVVILRESKRLLFYRNEKLVRSFRIATGQASYPTPLGRYEIVTKQRDPWWYPPPSDWAAGKDPVPPGPGNPLGTRWMGISAPYVGIHGTPDEASIGYSASHGCVRMRIADAEWLFRQVKIGTPVFILGR
ncbi:MAG TPA: L,D-transpeptidase family protein [Gaiellaceae bacterium]|nr:L,D-transpeptidase family protein [Gaiellaceae bacterium]